MLAGQFKEAKQRKVHIKDHDEDLVMWMLLYMYRGSFRTTEKFNPWMYSNGRKPLVTFAHVYAIAVEYDVLGMPEAAVREMGLLMDACFDDLDLIEAISVAYATTLDEYRGMRDLLLLRARPRQEIYSVFQEFEDVVAEHKSFAWDLISGKPREFICCEKCGEVPENNDRWCSCGWLGVCGRACAPLSSRYLECSKCQHKMDISHKDNHLIKRALKKAKRSPITEIPRGLREAMPAAEKKRQAEDEDRQDGNERVLSKRARTSVNEG